MKNYFQSQSIGEKKRARTRGLLLDTAIDVFSVKGIESASVQQITTDAGLANGTFYNHFKDKDELASASAEAIALVFTKRLDKEMLDLNRGVSRIVVASWAVMLIAFGAKTWAEVMLSQFQRQPTAHEDAFRYMRADIELAIEQGDIDGEVDQFLMEQIATLMIAAMRRMLLVGRIDEIPNRTCQHILRLLGMTPAKAKRVVEKVAEHPLLRDNR